MAQRPVVVERMKRTARRRRNPQYPFYVETRPFSITPVHISPVLPGETLTNAMLAARSITDPIKNRLAPWWQDFYAYYVKLSDLDLRDSYIGADGMLLNTAFDATTVDSTADNRGHYFDAGAGTGNIDWLGQCMARVVTEFFRDEEDGYTWSAGPNHTLGDNGRADATYPMAQRKGRDLFHSLAEEGDITFMDVDVDANADDTITVGEIDQARITYEFMRNNLGMQMGYEQWIAQYGIKIPTAALRKPEELFTLSQVQNPVSAIDPADGSAVSAVAWNWNAKEEGRWLFKEPGFILIVQVTRPKVYLSRQAGTFTSLMNSALRWYPPHLTNDPRSSLALIPDNTMIGDNTDAGGAWVDLRDLLLYGEQFTNVGSSLTDVNFVALPATDLDDRYPASAEIDALFVNASPENNVRTDGIWMLNVETVQKDQTV